MSVSVVLLKGTEEVDYFNLATEKQFREFRRWTHQYGEYSTLMRFSLRYQGEEYRDIFTTEGKGHDSDLVRLTRELVDLAKKIQGHQVPPEYEEIIFSLLNAATEALKEKYTLAIT